MAASETQVAPTLAPTLAQAALGVVEAIFVASAASIPMTSLQQVLAVAGQGLEGDRYAKGAGYHSANPGNGRHMTLIDAADLEAIEAESGALIRPIETRRNLVVRGARLLDLVGKRFWVGEALCEAMRECVPCAYLEGLTRPGVLKALVGRGGLRVEIREGGLIRLGDPIRLAD